MSFYFIQKINFGNVFDVDTVKKAMIDFDSGIISSAMMFHREIALAGIILVPENGGHIWSMV